MSVTIREVAQEAGVSQATAARALGGYGYVGAAARRSVLLAGERLGYRPNNAARTLASGSSGIVGLVVGDIENVFFAPLARGLADVVEDFGYTLLVANSDEDVSRERRAVDSLRTHRVDGIVVAPASNVDGVHLADAHSAGTAVVQVDRVVSGLKIDSVASDALAGASVAVQQLIAHGHQRIGIVIDSLKTPLSSMVMRLRGWRETLAAAGLPNDDSLLSEADGNKDDGYRATMNLLSRPHRPSA
ncbi:MAG: LacI family DNA-binding transcriptional regulator, partial [Actinomycetota bacterium]|nr:LacI family DNA-binding transcriptional regulator [Actinomycetota bacterium]